MAAITDITDAVVNELNDPGAPGFSQEFTAVRQYQPSFELAEMKTLHVTVVPKAVTVEVAGRGLTQHDCSIDIAVQKKFDTTEPAELDPLMALTEQIADHFRHKKLGDALWLRTENEPIFAVEHMAEQRLFTSVITVTFRMLR